MELKKKIAIFETICRAVMFAHKIKYFIVTLSRQIF